MTGLSIAGKRCTKFRFLAADFAPGGAGRDNLFLSAFLLFQTFSYDL